ncbi:hypothetical protein BGZ67_009662 [Mortierella alpina]|nr:hypothetical protein BGZ67_009662 [Mortierella alpina]
MSEPGRGRGGKKTKARAKKNVSVTIVPQQQQQQQQHQEPTTAIEDLVRPPLSSFVVQMEPPTPSATTLVDDADSPTRVLPAFVASPDPIRSSHRALSSQQQQQQHDLNDHGHTHPPEPSIGERFGRRHGLDWPSPPSGSANGRCVSCPGSRSESRSKSRGGARRTSGVLYKAIPARPVMAPSVFQAGRKSEDEIRAIKGKPQVQAYYRSLNELLDSFAEVEEILKEHREDERAKTQMSYQDQDLARTRHSTQDSVLSPAVNISYGSLMENTNGLTTPASPPATGIVAHTHLDGNSHHYHHDEEDLEEGAPLLEYKRKQKTSPRLVQLAINVSFLVNICLVIIKIWTVLLSDSLAVLASMIDSLMDLLSGAIIWYSARLRSNTSDGHRYPVGKARMEPLGIIVFAAVMVTSFMQVLVQAFERLVEGSAEPPVDLSLIILALLALNILIKTALWLWCRTMKDSSSVLALAQDHLNDVVFNVFSTLFPVAGQFLGLWWLDATGAIVLSIYIISEWTGTCLHNIRRLTGQAATPADIQQLTYMVYRYSSMIQAIDTVRAYSVGDGLFAEIDIVLPPDTPLSQAHDLGESLQGALERLDNVERAFVHVDYNAVHAIEHR